MPARRLAFGSVLGALLLTSHLAWADEPAPAPPPPGAPPPPVVAVDSTDPVCKDSTLVCEQTDAPPVVDFTEQIKMLGPILRDLRRCLDREGFQAVPASVRIKWGSNTLLSTLEVGSGLDTHACIMQAKAKFSNLQSNTPVALSCRYECKGDRLAPPPPPPVVVPPAPPPPPKEPPPPVEQPKPKPPPDSPPSTIEPPREEPHSSSSGSNWYGWQTLIADGASAGMLGIGLGSWTVESTVIGYAGFLLATPIVHAVHGNYGRALASFGLRLLLPAMAGGIGAAVNVAADGEDTTKKGVVTSAGIGMGLAAGACIIIDLAFLAWDKDEHRTGQNGPARYLSGTF